MNVQRGYGALPPPAMAWMMGRTVAEVDAIQQKAKYEGITPEAAARAYDAQSLPVTGLWETFIKMLCLW